MQVDGSLSHVGSHPAQHPHLHCRDPSHVRPLVCPQQLRINHQLRSRAVQRGAGVQEHVPLLLLWRLPAALACPRPNGVRQGGQQTRGLVADGVVLPPA